MKRENYFSWDEFFMSVALVAAQRSKDPSTQVGSCVVGENKRILGVGYNGFPNGCSDDELPWDRNGGFLDTKYAHVVHSEANCIISQTGNLNGSTIYVTLFPCNECAKLIIQSGIKEIVYLEDKYHDAEFTIAARRMLLMAGVKWRQYEGVPRIIFTNEKND